MDTSDCAVMRETGLHKKDNVLSQREAFANAYTFVKSAGVISKVRNKLVPLTAL